MTPHGPETEVFIKSSKEKLVPFKMKQDDLAFMFESMFMLKVTEYGLTNKVDKDYLKCWKGLKKYFNPKEINTKIE